ncbi:hypothetical protein GY45DRAFT_1324685 [Cubamyces sp. BRFM 1775]|nr:hypothetical protein GY45DRAFT_1324685 [Cubamyces sp. BRFM 1775]
MQFFSQIVTLAALFAASVVAYPGGGPIIHPGPAARVEATIWPGNPGPRDIEARCVGGPPKCLPPLQEN